MGDDLTTFGRPKHAPEETPGDFGEPEEKNGGDGAAGTGRSRPRLRRVAGWTATVSACLLVGFALLAPSELGRYSPGAFLRVPVEAIAGVCVVLLLPGRARKPVAALVGAFLGLLTIVKVTDIGFDSVLARKFDPILDWVLVRPAVEFLDSSMGETGATVVVVGVVVLAVAVLVLMTLSAVRLSGIVARHRMEAMRAAAALTVIWLVGAAFSAPLASYGAAHLAFDHAKQVTHSFQDREEFAKQASVDAFRNTPGSQLLTGLRGKDVVLAFVESYGRSAVEDPSMAPAVDATLDDGTRRLAAAGFSARSGYLTSPTAGGGSWLAHSTLLSGLWINNQQRYRAVVASDRLTLNKAFQRARWRSVAVVPGVTRTWPEGRFFGYDKIYADRDMGYHGPNFSWATMPDQYTLAEFQRTERAKPGHAPLMAEIPLLSSHMPWAPIPHMIGWQDVGDGSVYDSMPGQGEKPDVVWRDPGRVRTEYRRSIQYSVDSLISYVEKYGDKNLVLVFLGDHQPAPIVTGEGASRDVPITIVAHDKAVLDRISGWGWQDGLRPGHDAPVWPMSAFRDRFLTAFS
ncbi:sulfatase [Actinomadura barringtoniae]|uniref:Sulfatase n=1 Tax=Actinomadura barringtoniae TaxID=1427535 RepID=A0A939T8V7_9ACTN|nr:sulfatase [Actinomadura barringtoniae]MBO2450727.1 sulfatase [Actinomadura barringtoniae]